MKKFYTLMLLAVASLFSVSTAVAQVVTTVPQIVQTNSTDIVITFHADQGSKGLMGQPSTAEIYAHTGVITSTSTSQSDWQYATNWSTNLPKYRMTWVAENTWSLTIPSINSFYGITDPNVVVEKLAFVFRNANGTLEGKGAGNSDIFVDVVQAGFHLTLTTNATNNIVRDDSPVTFTASTTSDADISLYVGSMGSAPVASASGVTSLTHSQAFTQAGTYTIIAKATTGTETETATLTITRVDQSDEQTYPGGIPKMGPVENADGSVTFCIATLDATSSMLLVPSWTGYSVTDDCVMKCQKVNGFNYFWTTISGIDKTKDNLYYFLADGVTPIGDPYARLVLDPSNDKWIPSTVFPDLPAYPSDKVQNVPLAIYNPSREAYDWKVKSFKGVDQSDLLIYELLIRDFTGTEGERNGEGTIAGVLSKLDYIKSLGVNAVEFMPIMEFNGNNSWGYNTNFYFAPDKAYGTPADYRRLIDECHARGMAVILDIVFNQSDGLHPWYQLYPSNVNYFYNASSPHAYSVLNDWSQDCDLVQQQWHDCLKYWLSEYKADGFRFDLVKGLGDNSSYGNTYNASTNTWGTPSDANTNRYNATRVARMKVLHDAMREISPDAYFINENLATAQEENEMATDGEINWANINNASCQFAMGYSDDSDLNRFYAPDDSRTWGSTVSYAESHDEERMAYKQRIYGAAGVRNNVPMSMRRLGSVAAQMILSPGAHMIWQFQEFGADQTTKNSDGGNNTDPKKMVWSYLDDPDRAGLKESYSELLGIRANSPELFSQASSTDVNFSGWDTGRTLTLKNGNKELYLFVNPRVSAGLKFEVSVDLSSSAYHLVSASYGVTPQVNATSVTLDAGAYAVYATTNVSGIDEIASDFVTTPAIYAVDGSIYVEGCDPADVNVYTTSGVKVGTSSLPAGVYIVTAAGHASKVTVR
ncbi:MAG: alpha-amylase family glycosyl hydrolase [Lachnoclostridium sp.]|nr:alpha-amylase family glycosyl hydrolase [Lachnoclostridium sp.]